MAKKVLIVCTSNEKLGDTNDKTGLWMEELAAPYYCFKEAGFEITVASIQGGEIPVDEGSLNAPFVTPEVEKFLLDDGAFKQVEESLALADADWASFDAIFLPGGHGTCWDFPNSELLQRVLAGAAAAGKVIGAVCHGPVGLVNVTDAEGRSIVAGKKVTGFSNDEEYAVVKEDLVPFLLEDKLKELGGVYSKAADKWAPHAVRDGTLVTGQNPGSSMATAKLIVEALQA